MATHAFLFLPCICTTWYAGTQQYACFFTGPGCCFSRVLHTLKAISALRYSPDRVYHEFVGHYGAGGQRFAG